MRNKYYYKCTKCGSFQPSHAQYLECGNCGAWKIDEETQYYLQSTILKVETIGAAAALIFTYKAGKRQSIERATMQEVNELSKAERLEAISGRDVFALDDNELSLNLGESSYYLIEPITI